jgi:uncharacterized protein
MGALSIVGAMDLRVLEGTYALCRLDGGTPLPDWFSFDPPLSVAIRRGPDELSLVFPDARTPPDVDAARGWRALEIVGPLDLALTGITAEVATVLADADVAICPLATYDTDVILVQDDKLSDAAHALHAAGHTVTAA